MNPLARKPIRPMTVRETRDEVVLDDTVVGVVGDIHGAPHDVARIAKAARKHLIRHVFLCGDVWLGGGIEKTLDYHGDPQRAPGFEGITWWVLLGNHETAAAFETEQMLGEKFGRVGERVWLMPRPARLTVGGARVLAFGGAASVDVNWRTPDDWDIREAITTTQVEKALAGGPCDIMLTHETPDRTPVKDVQRMLATNPQGWPKNALEYSSAGREKLQRVWDDTAPQLLFHGHMHLPGAGTTPDGRRVVSLGMNGQRGHAVVLNTVTMEADPLPVG